MPGAIPVEPTANLGGWCRQPWPPLFSDSGLPASLTLLSQLGFVYEEQRIWGAVDAKRCHLWNLCSGVASKMVCITCDSSLKRTQQSRKESLRSTCIGHSVAGRGTLSRA